VKVIESSGQPINIFNLGANEYCTVNDSLGWICEAMGVSPQREYTGGERGWIGDSPFIFLDTAKVQSLGWTPRLTIRQGVERTVQYLRENAWLFEKR
jgi:UDP-glucose 4-epimerase